MDTLTPAQRSYNMSRIRSTDTKPEKQIRSVLFCMGFRFRKNDRRYHGTPDIVLPHYHAVIFVNGCFWHGHKGCKLFRIPKTNVDYWQNKIAEKKRASKINDVASEICYWLEEQQGEVLMEF